MFEVPMFNMDKFVHTFIQNLGLRIPSPVCKNSQNSNKITFIKYLDKAYKIKQQLFCNVEKIIDINMQENLDFSNEKDIQYFIEKHTSFFDKFTSLSNTWILTSHLKNINLKILQKVRSRRQNFENMKIMETKILNKNISCKKKVRTNIRNKLNGLKKNVPLITSCKEKFSNLYNYKRSKYRKASTLENSKVACHNIITLNSHKDNILKTMNSNQKVSISHNLPNSLVSMAKKEAEMAEGFLWLYTKDVESIKRKVHITLYVSKVV